MQPSTSGAYVLHNCDTAVRTSYSACRQMVEVAEEEERVILTCDRTFIRMGYSDQAFYVRTANKKEQLKEVLAYFKISLQPGNLLSRCAKCNGTFYPR